MKKLLLLFSIALSIGLNATIYLVQQGGANPAWSGATLTGKTLVDLTVEAKTFPAWFNDALTTFGATDQIWVMNGTYLFEATLAVKKVSIYGGFAGTETTIAERAKPVNAKYWEFTNETIFDGNTTSIKLINNSTSIGTGVIIYDGLTFTKSGGLFFRYNETLQNCKIINNSLTAGGGAGVSNYKAANTIKNCYFYNNIVTGTGTGGAIYTLQSTGGIIDGCVFDSNSATTNGSAIYLGAVSTGVLTVQNCLVTGSTGGTFIYTNIASNFYNNTFVNNNGTGGLYIAGTVALAVKIYNCVFWVSGGATGSNLGGVAVANTASVELKNCALTATPSNSGNWTKANNITLEATNTGSGSGLFYPGFVDPTAGNYKIAAGSSLINAGIAIDGMTTDFFGTTRPNGAAYDIGYHELDLGVSTMVPSQDVSALNAFSQNGAITVRGAKAGQVIEVYNAMGQKINSLIASDGDNTFSASSKGVQIIKIGNWVRKVILK